MALVIKNNAVGLLQLAIGAGAVSTTLQAGHTMPVLGAGDYCFATFVSTSNTVEVVKVTAIVGDVITHGATSNAFAAGSRFELRPCKEAMDALMQEATAKAAVTLTGTDTYAGTAAPVPTSYVGIAWVLKFTNANTIAAATVNLNSLGAKALKNRNGDALAPGDIKANAVHVAFYDGTNMVLVTMEPQGDVVGKCRLVKTGANLVLTPYNGNLLTVAGGRCTIPDAGVSLAPTGLQAVFATTTRSITANVATLGHGALSVALPVGTKVGVRDVGGATAYNGLKTVTASSTTTTSYACVAADEGTTADTGGRVQPVYYVYATAAAGVVNALEASNTGWAVSTTAGNKGAPIKSGDDTRTLVGMAALIAGPAWADTDAQRLVLSYWNRLNRTAKNAFTTDRSTSSTSAVEINAEIRTEALNWADEAVWGLLAGEAQASAAGALARTFIGIDGITTLEDGGGGSYAISTGYGGPAAAPVARTDLAEGYHYYTAVGFMNLGTGTWRGAAANNPRMSLQLLIRG